MKIEKCIKVELSQEDKVILLRAAGIVDALCETIAEEYSFDFEGMSNGLKDIAYEGHFEINIQE